MYCCLFSFLRTLMEKQTLMKEAILAKEKELHAKKKVLHEKKSDILHEKGEILELKDHLFQMKDHILELKEQQVLKEQQEDSFHEAEEEAREKEQLSGEDENKDSVQKKKKKKKKNKKKEEVEKKDLHKPEGSLGEMEQLLPGEDEDTKRMQSIRDRMVTYAMEKEAAVREDFKKSLKLGHNLAEKRKALEEELGKLMTNEKLIKKIEGEEATKATSSKNQESVIEEVPLFVQLHGSEEVEQVGGCLFQASDFVSSKMTKGGQSEYPIKLPEDVKAVHFRDICQYQIYHEAQGRSEKERKKFDKNFFKGKDNVQIAALGLAAVSLGLHRMLNSVRHKLDSAMGDASQDAIDLLFGDPDKANLVMPKKEKTGIQARIDKELKKKETSSSNPASTSGR